MKFILLFFALPGFLFLGPIGLGETLIDAITGNLSWWYPICWGIYWFTSIFVIFRMAHPSVQPGGTAARPANRQR